MSLMVLYRDFGSRYESDGPVISDINELEEIKQKLAEDGLDGNASNDDKLRHIWRLYTKADNGLQTSLKDVEQLRIQQTQEMQEVENYVEHIRSLSHEREQLTAEFEAENEKLKSENEQLRNELVDGANSEITQMLMQEGLEDVANGTTSEQIAYLLVERARLMDEVDIERKRVDDIEASQGFPDDYRLQETIRKEREAFEEERQNFKMTKESLQRLHDDELNRLKKDHQDQVRQKDKLIMELQNEVQKNNNMLERERKARKVDAEEKIVKQETILTQTASRDYELQHLKDKQMMMEEDKNILNEKIKELSEELQKEKTSRSNQEATLHKLRAVIERNKKVLAESEGSKQILADEKRALEMKLAFLQKDIDGMKDKEKTMVNVQSCEKDINDSLKKEIEDLKSKNRSLSLELESTNTALDRQRSKCRTMEEETAEAEKKIDEKKKEFENKENGLYQKLESMRLQLETSKDEVAATQKEIVRIQKQHRKELSEARSEAVNIRDELAKEIQSGRRSVDNTATLLEMENALDEVTRDRDTLARELQAIISKENKHEEWANKCRQLEDDKKEISSQLEETSKKQGELEHEIMLQKSLNSDLQTRLELSMKKAETAEAESDALRDEVSNLSSQIITQYETSKDGQGKLDKLVTQLHQELQVEKEANTKRQESLSQQLERERKLVKELQRQIAVRNEEAANEKLENGLNSAAREDELKKFNELEARNKHLEEELTKVWNQLKDVLDKLTASEQRKHELELEIERISRRHIDGELSDSVYQQKIELLERKIVNLKRDLDDATMRQQAAELHLRESATLKMDLQQERDEVIKIRNQLQQEKLERAMQEQTAIDMKLQLNSVKDKESKLHEDNMNLHHKLLDTESKLYITEDRSRSASDMVQLAEMGKKALMEQVIKLQKEVEVLQIDQLKYGEKLDFQLRKYEEKKVYCKNKLQHARDVFGRQKKMLADHLKNMEDDLSLTKTQLRKELEWKNEMENTLQKVLKEKRELLTKLIEIEETHRDTTNTLTTVDYRARYLDQENATLQTKLESMIRQKNIMEKLLKEYKLERQKEDITRAITNNGLLMSSRPETPGSISGFRPPTASSGIGTSLAHSFNSGDILNNPDVGLKSPPMVDSSYLNGLPVTRPFTSSGMRNYNSSLGGSMDTLDQLY